MEFREKTGKRGPAVNRCTEFTLGTRYVYIKERQFPVTLNLRSEGYIGVLLVEKFKEKRYVVQGSEEKKAVINISSVEYRFERRRTVLEPDLLMEGHEYIGRVDLMDCPLPRRQLVGISGH